MSTLLLLGLAAAALAVNPPTLVVSGGGKDNGTYQLVSGGYYTLNGATTGIGPGIQTGTNQYYLLGQMNYATGANTASSYPYGDYQQEGADPLTATAPWSVFQGSPGAVPTVTTPSLLSGSLSVGVATPTTLSLSWTAASGGTSPYSYQVLRAPDVSGAPGTFAPDGAPTSRLTFTDTGLTAGTKYWYEVAATDSASPTPSTATSAAIFGTTTILPQFVGLVSVSPQSAGDAVTVPGVVAGTNAIASASLYLGTSAGAELSTPALTVNNPTFPLTFSAQTPAAAGAGNYYVVRITDSAGYQSAASNEVAVKTSSLAHTGVTRAMQTFVAPYGPAFTGLTLGYTFYDSTGAVFARRSTAGVSELTGQGIYSVQPAVDTGLTGGYILWDAPGGTSPFTAAVSIPSVVVPARQPSRGR